MSTVPILLQLRNVYKQYGSPDGKDSVYILKDVSFKVAIGESIAIVGPSGSGKSTLLNIMGTLDNPTEGQVILEGQYLSLFDEKQLATTRNNNVGFVFQLHHLLPQCTVLENVLVPTLASSDNASKQKTEARAKKLLQRVGLSHRLSYRPGQLSGGECQRVAVVRALINEPKILLADEPTGSLDHASSKNMAQLLVDLNREEKVALIVVTHSMELAARMGKLYRLKDGALELDNSLTAS